MVSYLGASDRFRQVLRSEAMLDALGTVAYDAGTPEAIQRLRDRREQYIAQILRVTGDTVSESVMIRIRAIREVVGRIDGLLRSVRRPAKSGKAGGPGGPTTTNHERGKR